MEQAKAATKATGKPILALQLLGRLDEDLSCANSRFFQVALYPNAEVSKVLRFASFYIGNSSVLHRKSRLALEMVAS